MPLPNFRDRLWRPGPCKGEVNGAPAKLFSVPGASVKILLSCARGLLVLVRLEEKSTARQQNVFRSPMPLSNFRDRRRGVLVLVLVEERSAARQQNFGRSPQIAMRPFSTANAAHTRRKFSTIVKIFAKSEQDQNSKLVALVFSLLQTDEIFVNFC